MTLFAASKYLLIRKVSIKPNLQHGRAKPIRKKMEGKKKGKNSITAIDP